MRAVAKAATSPNADLVLAADRLFILAETFDVYVRDNPAVLADLDLTESATIAAGAMLDFVERLNAKLPEAAGSDIVKPVDRMFILTETFNLYVREEEAVADRFGLALRAGFLSHAMLGFYRRLGAHLPEGVS